MEGGLQLSPEPSPDDLSSPNPDQAAPLLQAQQRPPSKAEREEVHPESFSGAGNMEAETNETSVRKEEVDNEGSQTRIDQSEREKTGKQSEKENTNNEKVCEEEEASDQETADEGMPPSKGSEDESEEENEIQKESSDANNNSLESSQHDQEEYVDIPELPAQVLDELVLLKHQLLNDKYSIFKKKLLSSFVFGIRLRQWRRHFALMRLKWFWWIIQARALYLLTWTTVTRSKSSSP